MVTFQVVRHVFIQATGTTEAANVGKPQLRTKAWATRDHLNERALKEMEAPENQGRFISYSCAQCHKSPTASA